MQPLSATTKRFFRLARRGALLLALGAAGPAAWGQSFGPVSLYTTGANSSPYDVALGDVNGDGRLDAVITAYSINSVGVLMGQAGGFSAPAYYPTGSTAVNSRPMSVALGDVNNDGRLDIAVTNFGTIDVGVLLGQPNGFARVTNYTYSTGVGYPNDVAIGDINNDGRPDIISVHSIGSALGILVGQPGGGFAPMALYASETGFPAPTGTTGPGPTNVTLSDVNNDGRQDIITANFNGAIGVLLNQPNGFVGASYLAGGTTTAIAVGDTNGDGRLDVATNDRFGNAAAVLRGQATGPFSAPQSYPTGAGTAPVCLALGEINGDGRLDIVTANFGTNTVSVLLGQNGGGFSTATTYPIGGTGYLAFSLALGDVNGDGRLDIVVSNTGSNTINVLLNTGTYAPLATAHPAAAEITLTPNPAHEAFTVQLPAGFAPTQAALLNSLGQVVRRPAVGTARFTVETSGLAPGLYTLRLLAGGTALVRRVVVE